MTNQVVLSWSVSVAGTSRTPAQAATALAAVPLYANDDADPVLGQFFGLTVEDDVTAPTGTGATRTLTLNATSAVGSPTAPPAFPCHPNTSTPPTLPYALTVAEDLEGSFLVTNGSTNVPSTRSQLATLSDENEVQFAAQPGVTYTIAGVSAGALTISPAYSGETDNSAAVELVPTPIELDETGNLLAAVYSSSPLDSASGSGARTVSISYEDSEGHAGTVVVTLDAGYPVSLTPAAGTIDLAVVTGMHVASVGGFGNSVGQITFASLTETIDDDTQDAAQMKLDTALVYLPPSFFTLAQQTTSQPQMRGDFYVTTGSTWVPTEFDHTGILSPGHVIQFAAQLTETPASPPAGGPLQTLQVTYVIETVAPRGITLTEEYSGRDFNKKSSNENKRSNDLTGLAIEQPTGAFLISPSPAAPPTNAELGTLLGQFINPGIAVPPLNPPLTPMTMSPAPTILSGFFTQTLQLALAVPVTPAPIAYS